jgi:beta-lactamase regulating signal transducer with metallopeptidase domain
VAVNDLQELAPLLATYLLHSTLWIGGCGMLLWLTRVRNAAVRHTAWKWSVIAGFLTAISQYALPLTSNRFQWKLAPSAAPVSQIAQPHHTISSPAVVPATADEEGPHNEQPLVIEPPIANRSLLARDAPSHNGDAGSREQTFDAERLNRSGLNWFRGAVLLWLSCVLFLLGRLVVLWRRLGKLGDLTEVTNGRQRDLLDRLLAATKIRRPVRLFRSESGTNPMAWGFWRWRIVIPSSLVEQLDARELRALLAHELAHLARGDTRWLFAWSVLGAVGCFQPLNRIAQRQIRRAAELLSDGWAANVTGDRLSLARALTKTAELRSRVATPLASLAVASSSALAERVDRLIDNDPDARGEIRVSHSLVVIVASIAIAAAVAWMPGVKLTVAASLNEQPWSKTGSTIPVSPGDSVPSLDQELAALDAELDQLEPLVASRHAEAHVAEAWRAIEVRRAKVRGGHRRLKQLLEEVTSGAKSRDGHP